jgi:hypothetical protein
MPFQIEVTHRPSSRFGDSTPEVLPEPTRLQRLRTRTARRARMIYGDAPEVVLRDEHRHGAPPATWAGRGAADATVERLADMGWSARVVEVS